MHGNAVFQSKKLWLYFEPVRIGRIILSNEVDGQMVAFAIRLDCEVKLERLGLGKSVLVIQEIRVNVCVRQAEEVKTLRSPCKVHIPKGHVRGRRRKT